MNAPNMMQEYRLRGKAVGLILSISIDDITILSEYHESKSYLIKLSEQYLQTEQGKELSEEFLAGISYDNEQKTKNFYDGIIEGIELGLSKKGLYEDNRHLSLLRKSNNVKKVVSRISDFIENNVKKDISVDKKIFISNFNLFIRMKKIRDSNYQINLINNILEKIAGDSQIQNRITEIIEQSYGSYIDRWSFLQAGTNEIPESHILNNVNKINQIIVGEKQNESKN